MPIGSIYNHLFFGKASMAAIGEVAVSGSADFQNYSIVESVATVTVTTSAKADKIRYFAASSTVVCSSSVIGKVRAKIIATGNVGATPSAYDIAQAVWIQNALSVDIPGTTGAKINSAASAGDPWSTALPGTYTTGEAGKILADMETLIKQIKSLTTAQL